jgi:hypothetical protein
MPYALRKNGTGELFACMQVNGYQLAYYGVRLWDAYPNEETVKGALVAAGVEGVRAGDAEEAHLAGDDEEGLPDAGGYALRPEAGGADALAAQWRPVELTEHQAKMANVKLRNDPRRRVYLQDNVLTASVIE